MTATKAWIAIAAAVAGLASAGAGPGTLPASADWAAGPEWDDGLAEVAVYEAARVIYGAPRAYEAVLLTVKEDFDGHALVKADPPHGDRFIVTVLKQNAVREIPTPNYDYRIMTSTFVERERPSRVLKLTSGSHEWCGNTWKELRVRDGRATYNWSSYFDGEGSGLQELRLGPGDLLEDQLPLTLRGLQFHPGLKFEGRLLPGMATMHAGPARWRDATFHVVGKDTVDVPAGEIDCWRVDVSAGSDRTTLWFDVAGTHPLVRLETPDGDSLRLKTIERRAYWRLP